MAFAVGLFALLMLYPRISSMVFRLYNCTTIESTSYLVYDLSVVCYNAKYFVHVFVSLMRHRWWNYAGFGVIMILVYPVCSPSRLC